MHTRTQLLDTPIMDLIDGDLLDIDFHVKSDESDFKRVLKKYETSLPAPTPLDTTPLLDVSATSPVSVRDAIDEVIAALIPTPTTARCRPPRRAQHVPSLSPLRRPAPPGEIVQRDQGFRRRHEGGRVVGPLADVYAASWVEEARGATAVDSSRAESATGAAARRG